MLCDMIEYAQVEKEELITKGRLEKAMEVARNMLYEKFPIEVIVRATGLTKEQIVGTV